MVQNTITTSGAPEGFDATIVAKEAQNGGAIHIARDSRRLSEMRSALNFFAPDLPVFTFPAWDCLPYDRVSPNADICADRMAALATFLLDMPKAYVVLTSMAATTQRVPARSTLRDSVFQANLNDRVDEKSLRDFLVRMGFVQSPTVMEPGDYAVRGGIIDIFPPGATGPIRLDFFGDTLDGIRTFDPATQMTKDKLTHLELSPVSEIILDEASIRRFRQNYRIEFGASRVEDPLYEAVSAGRKHQGVEHWLPFFHENLETLFDYLPNASIVLDDQFQAARTSRWDTISDQYDTRKTALDQQGRMDSVYKPIPPGQMYLDDQAWTEATLNHRMVQLSVLPQPTGLGVVDAGAKIGRDFAPERQNEALSLFGALSNHIKHHQANGPVVITSYSAGSRERLSGLLSDEGHGELIEIKDIN
ncbi:MAG: transcription-repair coupling factor, partial [Planktomarina sp.]